MSGSLPSLLSTLTAADEGLLELTDEDLQELGKELFKKVDSYHYLLEKFEGEIERYTKRIAEFQEKKKNLQASKDRLKELLMYNMSVNKFEMLSGDDYQVKMHRRKDVDVNVTGDPTVMQYNTMPALVKQKFVWNNAAIKAGVKSGELDETYGAVVERPYLRWGVKG